MNFNEFPERIKASTKHADKLYSLASDYYAVNYGDEMQKAGDAFMVLEGENIAVYRGKPDKNIDSAVSLTPVYQLQESGLLAVPTGKIYLRFKESVEAKTQEQKITDAGYKIVEISPYAQHTAWVESSSGSIADSLSNIRLLEKLPDAENVEPQMLIKRVERND